MKELIENKIPTKEYEKIQIYHFENKIAEIQPDYKATEDFLNYLVDNDLERFRNYLLIKYGLLRLHNYDKMNDRASILKETMILGNGLILTKK